MKSQTRPLVIFALDSANLDLVERWSEADSLPNFARLLKYGKKFTIAGGGVYDEIGSWVSVFSGLSQYDHGYYCGRRLKHGTYQLEMVNTQNAGAEPFWAGFSNHGLKAAILDPPEGFIVEDLPGVQVMWLSMHQEEYIRRSSQFKSASLSQEVLKLMGRHETFKFDQFEKSDSYYRDQLQKNIQRMERRNRAFRELLSKEPFDLTVIGFGETHDATHLLWPWHCGEKKAQGDLDNPVLQIYQSIDKEIGYYLDMLPENAHICILSAYGTKSQYPTAMLGETLLERLGYQVPLKRKLNLTDPYSILRGMLPESIRRKLSKFLPLANQMHLLADNFTHRTDFANSVAFYIPSLYSNWIRINLEGREPQGMVKSGGEYVSLLDEIGHQFMQLIDPGTGKCAISSVLRTVDSAREDPVNSRLPDLVVQWKSSTQILDRVIHPQGEIRQPKPHFYRNSYHGLPGFALFNSPGMREVQSGHWSHLDLAPTFLELLNLDIPRNMSGVSRVDRFVGTNSYGS